MSATVDVVRIAEIVLRAVDPGRLAGFFRETLDFVEGPTDDTTRRLALGGTHLRIEAAGPNAAPYPAHVPGWSPRFQHFAIRVADMDAAIERLARVGDWMPISTAGPERLPANTGGVTAFKFRDPDGHPLEFLALPDRSTGPLFAAIDHSAISVADIDRSIAFYAALGFSVAGRSLNVGIEQQRLDGLDGAEVDVVGLRAASGEAPHLELLGYRGSFDRRSAGSDAIDDVAATRLVVSATGRTDGPRLLRDPDGHLIEFVDSAISAVVPPAGHRPAARSR